MNVLQRIETMVVTANTGDKILNDSLKEPIMKHVINALDTMSSSIGYDGIKYSAGVDHYPAMFYRIAWNAIIRPAVLEYLQEHHPQAWFNPMYMSPDEQQEVLAIGLKPKTVAINTPSMNHVIFNKNRKQFFMGNGTLESNDNRAFEAWTSNEQHAKKFFASDAQLFMEGKLTLTPVYDMEVRPVTQ